MYWEYKQASPPQIDQSKATKKFTRKNTGLPMASKQADQTENLPVGANDPAVQLRLIPRAVYAYHSIEHGCKWLVQDWSRAGFIVYSACKT